MKEMIQRISEEITALSEQINQAGTPEEFAALEVESERIWWHIRKLRRETDKEELYDRLTGLDVRIKAIRKGDKI